MGFCNNEYILISVSYSYYEVYTNTQRAFSGLGFTYGSDEDAAFITTWLEIFGLDGIKLLKLKIEELENTFNASIDASKINDEFDCENKSFLVIGPGLIDYLVSKIDKRDDFKLTFKNCSDPIFLIPLLYKYAKKNIYSQFLLDQKIDVQITNENIRVNREIISTNYQRNFDLLLTKKIFNEQKLDINISSSNINNLLLSLIHI